MNDFRELIAAWPTVPEFADDLGVSFNTAEGWRKRNSIPSWYWQGLLKSAKRRKIGVTADKLVTLASRSVA